MATCVVSGKLLDPSGTALPSIPVMFNIQTPILTAEPFQGSTTTAVDGSWSLSLQQGLSGVFTIDIQTDRLSRAVVYRFNANIPAASTATFSSTLVDY